MAIGSLQDGARKALREINNQETAWAVIVDDPNSNNIRLSILEAADRDQEFTYADFGTKNERITQIDYTSATVFPGVTARKIFLYTLVGTKYRLDNITWVIV